MKFVACIRPLPKSLFIGPSSRVLIVKNGTEQLRFPVDAAVETPDPTHVSRYVGFLADTASQGFESTVFVVGQLGSGRVSLCFVLFALVLMEVFAVPALSCEFTGRFVAFDCHAHWRESLCVQQGCITATVSSGKPCWIAFTALALADCAPVPQALYKEEFFDLSRTSLQRLRSSLPLHERSGAFELDDLKQHPVRDATDTAEHLRLCKRQLHRLFDGAKAKGDITHLVYTLQVVVHSSGDQSSTTVGQVRVVVLCPTGVRDLPGNDPSLSLAHRSMLAIGQVLRALSRTQRSRPRGNARSKSLIVPRGSRLPIRRTSVTTPSPKMQSESTPSQNTLSAASSKRHAGSICVATMQGHDKPGQSSGRHRRGKGGSAEVPAFVPYRNSNLTKLLKSSLTGHARLAVVACVLDGKDHVESTLNTLRFCQKLSHLPVSPRIRRVAPSPASEHAVRALRVLVDRIGPNSPSAQSPAPDASSVQSVAPDATSEQSSDLPPDPADSDDHKGDSDDSIETLREFLIMAASPTSSAGSKPSASASDDSQVPTKHTPAAAASQGTTDRDSDDLDDDKLPEWLTQVAPEDRLAAGNEVLCVLCGLCSTAFCFVVSAFDSFIAPEDIGDSSWSRCCPAAGAGTHSQRAYAFA